VFKGHDHSQTFNVYKNKLVLPSIITMQVVTNCSITLVKNLIRCIAFLVISVTFDLEVGAQNFSLLGL
jgi:hypothetical protein